MKLYCRHDGLWDGTKADAYRHSEFSHSGYDVVDVPTDKPGLLAWLNDRKVRIRAPKSDGRVPMPTPAPVPATIDLTSVEEFIQQCDHAQLARLADNVINRMREFAKGLS